MPIFNINYTITKHGYFVVDAKNEKEAIETSKKHVDYAECSAYDDSEIEVDSCTLDEEAKYGVSFGCLRGRLVELFRDNSEKFEKSYNAMSYKEYKKLKYGKRGNKTNEQT